MNIWEIEQRALVNKILEERKKYYLKFGEDPEYVVIPCHYKCLLDSLDSLDSLDIPCEFIANTAYDTYYGMQIIESKNCWSIESVMVY